MSISPEELLDGRELALPVLDAPLVVDFVVESVSSTLVATGLWWQQAWGAGAGLFPFDGLLVPFPQADDSRVHPDYHVEDILDATISQIFDDERSMYFSWVRRFRDIQRAEYLSQLELLEAAFAGEDFNFEPWRAAILARPRVDPVREQRQQNTGLRKIGRLFLKNQDNEVVDALVLDEHGNAASARGSDTLTVYEDDWTERETHPEMEDYLKWAVTQRPYGPFELDAISFEQGTGTVAEIATRMLNQAR